MTDTYKICSRCIIDSSDPFLELDENGVCNRCKNCMERLKNEIHTSEGDRELKAVVEKIRTAGKNNKYDCIIGLSGGVDSSYLAYMIKDLGLRPLCVHLDNGWNSELATQNIENIVKRLGIDLYTHVINWEEFRDLQVAFLKASTPEIEVPTDHAILAVLFEVAAKNNIKYVIPGSNVRTEGCVVPTWSQGHSDWRFIKSIHKKFGKLKRLTTYPHFNAFKFLYFTQIRKIERIRLLNYIEFDKDEALALLQEKFDWRAYTGKHGESIYTFFYQSYILPKKFGFDKRRMHYSSLICSGQMTRAEALAQIEKPVYTDREIAETKEYVAKKLGLSEQEFEDILNAPVKSFFDYPSYKSIPLLQNEKVKAFYNRFR